MTEAEFGLLIGSIAKELKCIAPLLQYIYINFDLYHRFYFIVPYRLRPEEMWATCNKELEPLRFSIRKTKRVSDNAVIYGIVNLAVSFHSQNHLFLHFF